jgi:hypothetical protein
MPRKKQLGICSVCLQTRPLFDVKNKICGPCAGKKGGLTPKKPRNARFFCDICEKPVIKGQQTCSCGAIVDWSNVQPVQQVSHGTAIG